MRGPSPAEPRARAPALRLSTVWASAALLVPPTLALGSMSSVDLAYLVRAGQVMGETGEVLRVDVFTFTAWCDPWLNQQWGVEIVLAGVFGALGWLGLALLRAALTLVTAAFVYSACRAHGAQRRAAAWLTVLAGLLLLGGFQLRAQLFGLLLFAAMRWLLAGREERPGRIWWAVPIVLLWANLHGSFPLGIFMLLMAWVADRAAGRGERRTIVVAGLCALATGVTPFGFRVWSYVVDVARDPLIREVVQEWQPPSITTYTGAAFFVSTAFAVIVLVRNRRSLRWPTWVELGVFLSLAASSTRAVHWWTIVLVVTLAGLPWARREPAADPRLRLNAVLVGALLTVPVIASIRWLPYATSEAPRTLVQYAPVGLTAELRTLLRPGEPFANAQSWGSWFELALPGHPVFADSRFELVPAEAARASIRISRADPGWEEDLDALPVRVYVVDRETQQPLVQALGSVAGWRRVHSDDDGIILLREDGQPAASLPGCPEAPG